MAFTYSTSCPIENISTKTSCFGKGSADILLRNEKTYRELSVGDLVKVNRGYFFHWAVYIGNGTVAHLTSASKDRKGCEICQCSYETNDQDQNPASDKDNMKMASSIDITSVCPKCAKHYFVQSEILVQNIKDVAGGNLVLKANDYDEKNNPLSPKEIKKRAKSKVGPSNYHWLEMNCEHFATWCRYDTPRSHQSYVLWHKAAEFIKALKQNIL